MTYKHNYSGEDSTSLPNIKLSYSYKTNIDQIANLVFVEQIKQAFDARLDGYKKQLDDILTFRSRYINAECLNDIGREIIRRVKLTPNPDNKFVMRWEVYDGGVLEYALNHELTLNELNKFLANMDEWTLDR